MSRASSVTFWSGWLFAAAGSLAACRMCLPAQDLSTLLFHTLCFFCFSAALGFSLFGIGHYVSVLLIRSPDSGAALALGMGCFAFFLNLYLKVSLNPVLPLVLLVCGFAWTLLNCFRKKTELLQILRRVDTPWLLLIFLLNLISLSFDSVRGGFVAFPSDFDSNLFHVTFPKIVVLHGHYFNPDWLRAAWLPQLTHSLYIFILTIADDLFLKALNVLCFVQIAALFMLPEKTICRIAGAVIFSLLCAIPEFRNNIVSTNLDAVFAFFAVSAFYQFCRFLKDAHLSSFTLAALLAAFAAGQKHFGLMFAVPLLGIMSILFVFGPAGERGRFKIPALLRTAQIGLLFLLTFSPFYIHNVMEGNNLLFPFFGAEQNTYGWDKSDLHQMLTDTIPHWGHSKSFAGFFLLPAHLHKYPDKYQFALTGSIFDFAVSAAIWFLYAVIPLGALFSRTRKAWLLLPALVLCSQVLAWYRGSQVIRYLLPVLISSCLFFSMIVARAAASSKLRPAALRIVSISCLILSLLLSTRHLSRPQFPLPLTSSERIAWISRYQSGATDAYVWLREHLASGDRVLHFGGVQAMLNFPDLILCGDWFGRFRYNRFLTTYIKFKDWPELHAQLAPYKFSHILVSWDAFAPHSSRPKSEQEWDSAIPKTTSKCLERVYTDQFNNDIYEIKPECR